MPKKFKIVLSDDTFEYVAYEEHSLIQSILDDTYKRIVAGFNHGNSASHYGLYYVNVGFCFFPFALVVANFEFTGGNWQGRVVRPRSFSSVLLPHKYGNYSLASSSSC